MSNKGKIIKNISIISVLFLVFIAMFNITSNAASKKTTLTQEDIQEMVKSDAWYTFDPNKYIGKTVVDHNYLDAGDEKYGYCIDPHTPQTGKYRIVNIIDINNRVKKEGQVNVYGVKQNGEKYEKKYTISKNSKLKPYIMTAYLAYRPYTTDGWLWNNYTTIQEIFNNNCYVEKMRDVGLYEGFKAQYGNKNSEEELLRNNKILKEAKKYADDYMKASSTSGYMEDNMTDKQKANVDFQVIGSKTYIGPYKINLKGDCKVERITVNGIGASKIVFAGSMDGIEKKPEKDVNKTPDNKYFYIVVNANLNKIDSVVLKGTKSKKILKGRLMVLAGGLAQDWIFYKAEESETPTELPLYCPTKKIGSIELTKKDELNANLNFKGVGFKLYNVNKGWVAEDSKGNKKYVKHFDDAKEYKTGENGKVTIKNVDAGKYKIFETSIPNELKKYYKLGTWKVPIFGTEEREVRTAVAIESKKVNGKSYYVHTVTDGTTVKVKKVNTRAYSALQIQKVDTKNPNAKLTGIKFRLYKVGPDAGWVTVDNIAISNDGIMNYTGTVPDSEYDTNKKIAEFITINNLTPTIEKLPLGTYQVYEVDVGPYTDKYKLGEFSVDGGKTYHKGDRKGEVAVGVNKQGIVIYKAENTPVPHDKNISIKGYVWKDVPGGKNGQRKDREYDKDEELMQGIKVELVDTTTGKVEQTTTTDANGAYRFDNVSTEKLANYIVRFVYDGYTYQDVISNYNEVQKDKENTSKAVEDETRDNLNKLFTELNGEGQKLSNGVEVNYKKTEDSVRITNKNDTPNGEDGTLEKLPKVQANTQNGLLKEYYDKDTTVEVIENINLGLYEREMPDLRIQKDTENATISLDGYEYTYSYDKRGISDTSLGVDFDGDYALPVYKADVKYVKENAGKELEASVMYKIKLQNTSTNLYTTVNSIKEAFSKNYKLMTDEIYLSDENTFNEGTAKKIAVEEFKPNESDEYYYGELKFKEPIKLGPAANVDGQRAYKNTQYIYVRLKITNVTKEFELKAMGKSPEDSQSNLRNIVEISRYSVYSDAELKNKYAGVDSTSIPNNLDLETYTPNEDDDDKAPGIRIVDAGSRTLSGTVFEDTPLQDKLNNDRERIGNGQLDDSEKRIKGITVKLVNQNGEDVKVYDGQNEVTTDENGNFTISGFIPGQYKLKYTWGDDNGYNVVDYKATIYNQQAADNWFKGNTEKYSIALDNYTTRKAIDKKALNLKDTNYTAEELTAINAVNDLTKMDSTTKKFTVGIEAKESNEALGINGTNEDLFQNAKFIFAANDADFGIIERPRQSLDLDKKVTSILVTTDQGQTVADAKIENGKLNVTTGASYISGGEDLGYIWLQIDKSITQAMTAKIGYTIKVSNNSEVDYADEDYYNYGTKTKNAVQMTLKADAIYDYMKGENLSSEEGLWKTVSISDYENELSKYEEKQTITERSFISQADTFEKDETNKLKSIGNWKTKIDKMQDIYEGWGNELINTVIDTTTVRSVKLAERDIAEYSKEDNKLTRAMTPGESESVEIMTSKLISNGDDIRFDNDAEIAEITFETNQKVGRKPSALTSKTYDRAGWVSITPATGEDRDYTWIIVTAVSAIAVLGVGIIFIKKKILK